MKLFGSLTRLVSVIFRKSGFDVTVEPVSASANTVFQLPAAGGGTKAIVTADATQTLTNKSIDADSNTITNIENADIKASAGIVESKLSLDYSTSSLNTAISDHISDASDAHDASAISNVPAGSIAATDVQAALNELDTEKLAKAGGTMSGNIAMGGNKVTGLAAGSANGDAVRYEQLTAVEAMINGLEFQDSALDYITDNTVAPPTEVSGDRYVLSATGGAPHANYDGAAAGNIVEFNGSVWVATPATTGMFISIDDEPTVLYYYGGSAWATRSFEATTASTGLVKVGVDIRLAAAAENASGIEVTAGGVIQLNDLGAFSTTGLSEGTNLYFTDTRARTAAVADAINDGTINIAPSQNAVFDALALKTDKTTAINTAADSGLSGGGDLSASRSLVIDPSNAPTEASLASGDFVLIRDVSASALKKVTTCCTSIN